MSSEPNVSKAPPSPKLIGYLYELWDYVSTTEKWPSAYHNQNKGEVMSLSIRVYKLSKEEDYHSPKHLGQGLWNWWAVANKYFGAPKECPLSTIAESFASNPPPSLFKEHPRPDSLTNHVELQIQAVRAEENAKQATAKAKAVEESTLRQPSQITDTTKGVKKAPPKRPASEHSERDSPQDAKPNPPPKKKRATAAAKKASAQSQEAAKVKTEPPFVSMPPVGHNNTPNDSLQPSVAHLLYSRAPNDLPTGDVRRDLLNLLELHREQTPKVNEAIAKSDTVSKAKKDLEDTLKHQTLTLGIHNSHFTSIFSRLTRLEEEADIRGRLLSRISAELGAIKQHLKSSRRSEPFDDSQVFDGYEPLFPGPNGGTSPHPQGPQDSLVGGDVHNTSTSPTFSAQFSQLNGDHGEPSSFQSAPSSFMHPAPSVQPNSLPLNTPFNQVTNTSLSLSPFQDLSLPNPSLSTSTQGQPSNQEHLLNAQE